MWLYNPIRYPHTIIYPANRQFSAVLWRHSFLWLKSYYMYFQLNQILLDIYKLYEWWDFYIPTQEEFEDTTGAIRSRKTRYSTTGVIRSRKTKRDRWCKGQRSNDIRKNNYLQNTTQQNTKHWTTKTSLQPRWTQVMSIVFTQAHCLPLVL